MCEITPSRVTLSLLSSCQTLQDIKVTFDIKHRLLRHEKFRLDVMDKVGLLRINTLQVELLLLMECGSVEGSIQDRINKCMEQKNEIERTVKHLQAQASKQNKELEEVRMGAVGGRGECV